MNLARHLMVDLSGPQLTSEERQFLTDARPGGVCLFGRNIEDPLQVAALVNELRELLGRDLLIGIDQARSTPICHTKMTSLAVGGRNAVTKPTSWSPSLATRQVSEKNFPIMR